jgi:hypothetical protein
MKIYKIVLVGAIALSGYLGYSNFIKVDLSEITEILAPTSMEDAEETTKKRVRPSPSEEKQKSTSDIIIEIVQTLAPLLAPVFASRKRTDKKGQVKTLDEDVRDIAEHLGVSRAFVRGKLGLGDQRKKQTGTTHKRRVSDKRT